MKITKRQLKRIILQETMKLVEDSVSDELDNLKKNVEDDKKHIENLEKDIDDDREEEARAHDAEKNESRFRTKRMLRKMIKAAMNEEHSARSPRTITGFETSQDARGRVALKRSIARRLKETLRRHR